MEGSSGEKFTLSYIGVLEQLRNPALLWEVLAELLKGKSDFAQDFQLKFVGRVDDKILENIYQKGLSNIIHNVGYVPHDRALEEMKNSEVLLITNFDEETSRGIIPGKLFEYLAMQKQIISFGTHGSDVEKILTETQSGKHFTYHQKDEVKAFILEQYQAWKQGKIQNNLSDIQRYSRRNITKELVKYL